MNAPRIPLIINYRFWYNTGDFRDPDWQKLPWREKYGTLVGTLETERHPKLYPKHWRFFFMVEGGPTTGYFIRYNFSLGGLEDAEICVQKLRNIIRFVDLSELKPGRTRSTDSEVVERMHDVPWDHASVWRDENLNLVLLNEPHVTYDFANWCEAHGWRFVLLPRHIGTYRAGATHCYLVAPPKSRANLESIAQRLILGWPA